MTIITDTDRADRPGVLLRIIRTEAGLSAAEAAERAGVPVALLERVEGCLEDASPAWMGAVASVCSSAIKSAGRAPGEQPEEDA